MATLEAGRAALPDQHRLRQAPLREKSFNSDWPCCRKIWTITMVNASLISRLTQLT